MQLPNNISFAIATAYATAITLTAVSNASEAVATATNTLAAGDLVEYTGGWSQASNRVFRVKAPSGTQFTLEGLDTSDTSLFPVGAGVGSVRKITTRVPIAQVTAADISGGDGKTVNVPLLDTSVDVTLPDGFNATALTLTIADEISRPHHAALKAISDGVKIAALIGTLPGGGLLLYSGYCSFNENPSLSKGSVMAVKATFSLLNKVVRY